eukprot:Clim_evm23s109 gene=Clim_evmTU23s109
MVPNPKTYGWVMWTMDVSFDSTTWCFVHASIFVGSLYVTARGQGESRNSINVIRRRSVAVLVSCGISFAIMAYTIDQGSMRQTAKDAGFLTADPWRLALPLLWFTALFLGPLVQLILDEGSLWDNADLPNNEQELYICIRNVITAPFAEEWVFRGIMLHTLVHDGFDLSQACYIAPLFFGFAHVHHVYEKVYVDKTTWHQALAGAFVQFAYTFLFGWICSHVYIATHSFWACFLAHAFCNFMGLPDFGSVPQHKHRLLVIPAYVTGLAVAVGTWNDVMNPGTYTS